MWPASSTIPSWRPRASRQPSAGQAGWEHRKGELAVVIAGATGEPLSDLNVVAKLSVPAHEHRDQQVTLRSTATGGYLLQIALDPGQWQADILATSPTGETYRQVFRFIVKPQS